MVAQVHGNLKRLRANRETALETQLPGCVNPREVLFECCCARVLRLCDVIC